MQFEIHTSETYEAWFNSLRDTIAKGRIIARLRRIEQGNLGVHKHLRDGVHELIFDFGPGYRIYYLVDGPVVVVLLAGGDKSSQVRDIENAARIAAEWRSQ